MAAAGINADAMDRLCKELDAGIKETRQYLLDAVKTASVIQHGVNCIIQRRGGEPFASVTAALSAAFVQFYHAVKDGKAAPDAAILTGIATGEGIPAKLTKAEAAADLTLEQMGWVVEGYDAWYNDNYEKVYGVYGYTREQLSTDEATELAGKLVADALDNPERRIGLHCYGNNSPECADMALELYDAIWGQAIEQAGNADQLIKLMQRVFFANSSAGGKATDVAVVKGKAIPEFEVMAVGGGGTLTDLMEHKPGDYYIKGCSVNGDGPNSLQQFGDSPAIQLQILHSKAGEPFAVVWPCNEAGELVGEKPLFSQAQPIQVITPAPGKTALFFGVTEAKANEERLTDALADRLEPKSEWLQGHLQRWEDRRCSKPEIGLLDVAEIVKMKSPDFVYEGATFNTGANAVAIGRAIHDKFVDAAANVNLVSFQRWPQSIRASTTGPTQYDGPWQSMCYLMHPRPFGGWPETLTDIADGQVRKKAVVSQVVTAVLFYKELVTELWYCAMDKRYHHPIAINGAHYRQAMEAIVWLYNRGTSGDHETPETLTLDQAKAFFDAVWPQVEALIAATCEEPDCRAGFSVTPSLVASPLSADEPAPGCGGNLPASPSRSPGMECLGSSREMEYS